MMILDLGMCMQIFFVKLLLDKFMIYLHYTIQKYREASGIKRPHYAF